MANFQTEKWKISVTGCGEKQRKTACKASQKHIANAKPNVCVKRGDWPYRPLVKGFTLSAFALWGRNLPI
ncbi:hypothetical protein NS381_02505 [Pantoea stewartii]|nr:hypothetical protein NS381_02505 [Pantoea stewartii]